MKNINTSKKRHNVSMILYHIVLVAKYRKSVFIGQVDELIINTCKEIEDKFEIIFHEIWSDENHIHLLIQTVPKFSPQKLIQITKSITAKEIFKTYPEIKKRLWWWQFRTDWYYINTVWWYWTVELIEKHIQNQWNNKTYKKMYRTQKTENLFWDWIYT